MHTGTKGFCSIEFQLENVARNVFFGIGSSREKDFTQINGSNDMMIFYNRNTIKLEFPEFFIFFAIFMNSLFFASANYERTLSRMGQLARESKFKSKLEIWTKDLLLQIRSRRTSAFYLFAMTKK